MNYVIKNKTASVLSLAPLKDVMGVVIALQPSGKRGDASEVDEATVASEIVERVYRAEWIDVDAMSTRPPEPEVVTPPAPTVEIKDPAPPEPPPPGAPAAPEAVSEPEPAAPAAPEAVSEPEPAATQEPAAQAAPSPDASATSPAPVAAAAKSKRR